MKNLYIGNLFKRKFNYKIMNKFLFLLLIHTSLSLFIPFSNIPKLQILKHNCDISKTIVKANNNNNENKNKSKIYKITFNNNHLEETNDDLLFYLYTIIIFNYLLFVYIIQNI